VDLPARYPVIDTQIAAFSFDEALELLLRAPADGRRIHVHFCTVHSVVEAADDDELRSVFNAPDSIASPDGMPLVWVGRARRRRVARVCGPDVMPALMDRGRTIGARHFFYGGAPGVADRLADRLAESYPGLVVAGTHSPPFRALTPDEEQTEIAMINDARPDYVWIGLGAPKQDLWAARHRAALEAPVLLAVGAAFDFHSGGLRRAPAWMQRAGLEWLFRLLAEPRRLVRRYAVTNSRFVYLLGKDLVAGRRLKGTKG
jgi:N-acetylglucosaminyldiphosphoundecaprenol N-acetyl-beta-D-mannosaminyltransferase